MLPEKRHQPVSRDTPLVVQQEEEVWIDESAA